MSVVQQRVIKRNPSRSIVCVDQANRRAVGTAGAMRVVLTLTPDGIQTDISGELDFSTSARLDQVFRLVEGFDNLVLVDLSGVTFTDSTGLSPLLESASRRAANGAEPIVLTALSRASRRILDVLSDLDEVKLLTRVAPAR
jgi:anti-sigma B factor antagonist